MKFTIIYHPQVQPELLEIIDWYEARRMGLGKLFIENFDETVKALLFSPRAFAKKNKKYRQLKLSRFPYILVYGVNHTTIEVFHVIHAKRHVKHRAVHKA